MHSRSNEISNELVKEIIESDGALKATVGIVDLLIFPSILLPEQNQCKYSVVKFLFSSDILHT